MVTLLFPPASDLESDRFFDGESFDLADRGASGISIPSAFTSIGARPGVDADADLEWVSVSLFAICAILKSLINSLKTEAWNQEDER